MNNKEKALKEALQRQSNSISADEIWENISPYIPRKKSRKSLAFLYLSGSLVLITFFLVASYSSKQGKTTLETDSRKNVEASVITSSKNKTVLENSFITKESKSKHNNLSAKHSVSKEVKIPPSSEKTLPIISTLLPNKNTNSNLSSFPVEVDESIHLSRSLLEQVKLIPSRKNRIRHGIDTFHPGLHVVPVVQRKSFQRTSIVLLLGPNLSFPENTAVLAPSNEIGLTGLSTQLSVNYSMKRRWSLRAGLGFTHSVVRYHNSSTKTSFGSAEGIAEIHIDALGNQREVLDLTPKTTITHNNITWHRRHSGIDLSLLLQKDFILNQNWRIGVQGGFSQNLYTYSKGYIFDFNEQTKFIKSKTNTSSFYRNSFGGSLIAGLEFARQFGRWEMLINTNFLHTLNPINTHQIKYQIHHSQAGIQLGTRYILQGNKNN